jgi:pyrimidine deaminase RibD-like protein
MRACLEGARSVGALCSPSGQSGAVLVGGAEVVAEEAKEGRWRGAGRTA